MGKIWSKKAKTTSELLETLDEKIKTLEAYTLSTQEQQKRLIGQFLVISIGLYVISFIVFYFLFFPPTWQERIVYSTPLLVFPFVIFSIKRLVAWYFQRKVNKNSSQLQELRTEKKKLLEKVMDSETYKVALDLLHRFSEKPTLLRTNPQPSSSPRTALKESPVPVQQQSRQTMLAPKPLTPSHSSVLPSTPLTSIRSPYNTSASYQLNRLPNTPYQQQQQQQQTIRTPFPIIDQRNKSVVEKLVDYLVGDGPSNRFAMICKKCMRHNGMVLQEEYEYTAFECAFCATLNPARKQRPIAPRLESTPERKLAERRLSSSSTSEEERISGSDSEEETQNKPVESQEIPEAQDSEPKPETEKKNE